MRRSNFETAVTHTIRVEGGYVDHPADPGGATNFGVSLRALRSLERGNLGFWDLDGDGDVTPEDMKLLTLEKAKLFYRRHFWNPRYEEIVSQSIATKIFDIHVNTGRSPAIMIVQNALNTFGHNLVVDGQFGPKSLNALNKNISFYLEGPTLMAIQHRQANFYRGLVVSKRERSVFLLGWLNRAFDMV